MKKYSYPQVTKRLDGIYQKRDLNFCSNCKMMGHMACTRLIPNTIISYKALD